MKDHVVVFPEINAYWTGHGWTSLKDKAELMTKDSANGKVKDLYDAAARFNRVPRKILAVPADQAEAELQRPENKYTPPVQLQ